jgi:hypothetical protein
MNTPSHAQEIDAELQEACRLALEWEEYVTLDEFHFAEAMALRPQWEAEDRMEEENRQKAAKLQAELDEADGLTFQQHYFATEISMADAWEVARIEADIAAAFSLAQQ